MALCGLVCRINKLTVFDLRWERVKMRSTEDYEILYDLPKGEYGQTEIGGIRTKTIRAGDSLEVECFPIVRITERVERERMRRKSSPAQEQMNHRNTVKRVRRLLEANFGAGDFAVHPTWDYGIVDRGAANIQDTIEAMERAGMPMSEADAKRQLRNYIRRIRRRVKALGGDPREVKYLYSLESSREPRDEDPNPLPAKYHFHMALHAQGMTREELEGLWESGYCNADRLDLRDNGLAAFAAYITKQRRCTRRWGRSTNLTEPEVTTSDRKVSRRRAALVARDVMQWGRQILEQVYPGYRCVEEPQVRFSDFVAGAYIYARLRKERPRDDCARRGKRT